MKRLVAVLTIAVLVGAFPGSAVADHGERLNAVPFEFVGTAAQCGGAAGSRIVTAAWLGGMGLPDSGGDAALNSPNPATRNDPHSGLLLSKNGPTADCSSSGARIKGVEGMTTTATSALGFDYRVGGHCGAGAGRYNVTVRNSLTGTETFHFVGGCANDNEATTAPQDPLQWNRVRFEFSDPGESFPVIPAGSRIVSISILYDEGTDTVLPPNNMGGVGLTVIDNIFIDGRVIRSGSNDRHGDRDRDDDDDDEDDD